MASDHVGSLAVFGALSDDARLIAFSRRGYGGSGAPEPYTGTTVQEQCEDARAVLRALAPGGALVAGQGFGALIALDLMLRYGGLVRGAVLTDPPLLAFVPDATRALADERGRIEQAVRDGGPGDGVDAWLTGHGGIERAGSAPPAGEPGSAAPGEAGRRDRARVATAAFFADYAGLASWPVTRGELRSIAAPLVVLTGAASAAHITAAADALAALAPNATRRHDGELEDAVRSLLAGL